jgi:hypothetical protein
MPATVYIWDNYTTVRVGHASMLIQGSRESKYVSNTPEGHPGIFDLMLDPRDRKSAVNVKFEHDRAFPPKGHGAPTHTIQLNNIDCDRMLETWRDMQKVYNLYCMNCSTAVAKLLTVGFAHQVVGFSVIDDLILHFRSGNLIPNRLPRVDDPDLHHRDLERAFAAFDFSAYRATAARLTARAKQVFGWMFVAETLGKVFIWYPGQVLRLARHIKEHGG